MDKIIVSDKLYVPRHHIPDKRVQKHYFKSFFSDYGCKQCDFRPHRPVDQCKGCENFGGSYQLAETRVIGNVEYIGLPLGDRENIEENMRIDFDDYKIVDKRTRAEFDYKIKIDLGEDRDWFPHQIKTVKRMSKAKYGLFILPPRSGKSLTALKLAIELGHKVLLTADQYDFLNQFIGDIEESTNLPALQERTGKKLYGFVKTIEDLKDIQIGIITYQSFLSKKGRKLLKACNKTFGTIIVDEVQSCIPGDAEILMADGSYSLMRDVVQNFQTAKIMTYNHATGTQEPSSLLYGSSMGHKKLIRIEHESGVFECTADHKVWSHTRECYIEAGQIMPDEEIEISDGA